MILSITLYLHIKDVTLFSSVHYTEYTSSASNECQGDNDLEANIQVEAKG